MSVKAGQVGKGERGRDGPVLDLLGHGEERLFDVGGVLGRSLEQADADLVGKLFRDGVVDDFFRRQVRLVADEEFVDPFAGVAVNLLEPLLYVGEGVLIGDVVDDNDAVGAAVVGRGDGAEAFLACRVPDLEFDRLAFEFDGADLEIYADGRDVRLGVGVVCEPEEQARLADARVADQEELCAAAGGRQSG